MRLVEIGCEITACQLLPLDTVDSGFWILFDTGSWKLLFEF